MILLHAGLVLLLLVILLLFKNKSKSVDKKSGTSIGGLVGRMEGGTIRGSKAQGTIRFRGSPENVNAGGLVGSMSGESLIEDSSSDMIIECYAKELDDILYNRPLKFWGIGGFFIFLLWSIFLVVNYLFQNYTPVELILLIALTAVIYILTGSMILKFYSKINDDTFLKLIRFSSKKVVDMLKFFWKSKIKGQEEIEL